VRVGFNLKLFTFLSESGKPVTVDELAKKTGGEAAFIGQSNIVQTRNLQLQVLTCCRVGRLMRYLASIGAVTETGKDEFAAGHVTKNLATPVTEAGISHW
jgi:hypothetical protein